MRVIYLKTLRFHVLNTTGTQTERDYGQEQEDPHQCD